MLKRLFPFLSLCVLSAYATHEDTNKLEVQLLQLFKGWESIRVKDRVISASFSAEKDSMYHMAIDEKERLMFKILDLTSKSEAYSVDIPDYLKFVSFANAGSNKIYFLEVTKGDFVELDIPTKVFRKIKKLGYPMVISADGNNVLVSCMDGFYLWDQQDESFRVIRQVTHLGISAMAIGQLFKDRLYVAGLFEDSSGLPNFNVYNIADVNQPVNSVKIPDNSGPFTIKIHDSFIYLLSNPRLERKGELIRMNLNGDIIAKETVNGLIRDFRFLPSGDLVYADLTSLRCMNKELNQIKWSLKLKDVSQINVVQDKILIDHSVENEKTLLIINASNGEVSDKIKYDEVIKVLNEKVILLNGKTLLFEK